jgi:hypothetical protein
VEKVEIRVSVTEHKVEELDQTVKDHKIMIRKYEWNMGHHENTKPMNHGYRRKRGNTN